MEISGETLIALKYFLGL